jgi:hypothetical protein
MAPRQETQMVTMSNACQANYWCTSDRISTATLDRRVKMTLVSRSQTRLTRAHKRETQMGTIEITLSHARHTNYWYISDRISTAMREMQMDTMHDAYHANCWCTSDRISTARPNRKVKVQMVTMSHACHTNQWCTPDRISTASPHKTVRVTMVLGFHTELTTACKRETQMVTTSNACPPGERR